jgi:cytochrome c-type biogenesis protein CcmE
MKKTQIILIVILAAAVGVIISMRGDASSYVPFSKAGQNPTESYHVVGKLDKSRPMEYNPHEDANKFSFYLKDGEGKECQVIFHGTKPENFEHADQVVIVGKAVGNGQFVADKILTKCPSKYDKSRPSQAGA